MRGLEEYVRKHGFHFTEALARDILGDDLKWDLPEIEQIASTRVWYNVTGSTDGDFLYYVNSSIESTKKKSVDFALRIIGDFKYYNFALKRILNTWKLLENIGYETDFDFTPYI